jgi:hypothetical protein
LKKAWEILLKRLLTSSIELKAPPPSLPLHKGEELKAHLVASRE